MQSVVNYEGFVLDRDLEDSYAEMASEAVRHWYSGVTRFTTSALMRAKLREALARRKLAPYIFESEAEALRNLAALNTLTGQAMDVLRGFAASARRTTIDQQAVEDVRAQCCLVWWRPRDAAQVAVPARDHCVCRRRVCSFCATCGSSNSLTW